MAPRKWVIVFDDADLDAAIERAMISKFRNAGQTCVCANRIYVQAGVYDAFAAKLVARVKTLKSGFGLDEGVTQGPLINESARHRALSHIVDAVEQGARAAIGGRSFEGPGHFMEPTVLLDVTQQMLCMQDETFGPVAPLVRCDTEQEAIDLANSTEFGRATRSCLHENEQMLPEKPKLRYPFPEPPASGTMKEVMPGVHWIRMPLPFKLDHINLWALNDGKDWALVDTGMRNDETVRVWRDLLGGAREPKALTRVFVTHMHPDHIGMAGWLTRKLGARLWMTRLEYMVCRVMASDSGREAPPDALAFFR